MTRGPRLRPLVMGLALTACGTAGPSQERESPSVPAPPPPDELPAKPPTAPPGPAPDACHDEPGMVYIPGGEYTNAIRKKTTRLSDFWIDRTEITVAAYRAFVAAGNPPPHSPEERRHSHPICTWNLPDNDELPINCIDWHQADAYCRWAGKRLPTVEEWGWAAQGREEDRRYPWGDAEPSCDLAVVDQNDEDDVRGCGRNQPWPVGTKPTDVTRDGVLDMVGNVGEKTSSGFSDEARSPRLSRGASWRTGTSTEMTVDEFGSVAVREAWSDGAGVRCVKDAGPKPPCAAGVTGHFHQSPRMRLQVDDAQRAMNSPTIPQI